MKANDKLRHGVQRSRFQLDARGEVHPHEDELRRVAGDMGLVLNDARAILFTVLLAVMASAFMGVLFWAPWVDAWLVDYFPERLAQQLAGAGASLVVLGVMAEGWRSYYEARFSGRGMSARAWTWAALAGAVFLVEVGAVGVGLAGQHSGGLDPTAAYMPYVVGLLVSLGNLIAARRLGLITAARLVVHQTAVGGLDPDEVGEARFELGELRELARTEREADALASRPPLVGRRGPARPGEGGGGAAR